MWAATVWSLRLMEKQKCLCIDKFAVPSQSKSLDGSHEWSSWHCILCVICPVLVTVPSEHWIDILDPTTTGRVPAINARFGSKYSASLHVTSKVQCFMTSSCMHNNRIMYVINVSKHREQIVKLYWCTCAVEWKIFMYCFSTNLTVSFEYLNINTCTI